VGQSLPKNEDDSKEFHLAGLPIPRWTKQPRPQAYQGCGVMELACSIGAKRDTEPNTEQVYSWG